MKYLAIVFSSLFCVMQLQTVVAETIHDSAANHPLYGGLTLGYGTTTWGGLVSTDQNAAMLFSTPEKVTEGGIVWGGFLGYQFLPNFALETSYMHYPDAKIYFDPTSLFTFYNSLTEVTSSTETISLMGKFMVLIPSTSSVRAYSSIGGAMIHRNDVVQDWWRLRPAFGCGVDWDVSPRVMLEIGAEYVAGNGESEIDPVEDYLPFVYAGYVRLAYRF